MIPDSKDTSFSSFGHVQEIIDYMEENLLEKLSPAIIATHFSVSASVLSSLIIPLSQAKRIRMYPPGSLLMGRKEKTK